MRNAGERHGLLKDPADGAALASEPAPGSAWPGKISRRRRWGRRLLVAALVLACLYLCRARILRAVGGFLIVDESPAGSALLVLGGDRCGERAIDLYQSGAATEIVLLPWHPGRLEIMGIRAPFASALRLRLRERGLPEQAVTVIPGDVHTAWEGARCLRDWLEGHPDAELTAVCPQFSGRKLRHIFDAVLGPEAAGRVRLRGLRHRWYDETEWWQNKDGLKEVFNAYLGLGHVWFNGEGTEEWREWEPDQYEKTLR